MLFGLPGGNLGWGVLSAPVVPLGLQNHAGEHVLAGFANVDDAVKLLDLGLEGVLGEGVKLLDALV
jgi:hypothetical protein